MATVKRNRIRKGSIADRAKKAAAVIDRQPWAMIAFGITCAGIMIILALAYNSVVPAYQ